MPAKSSSATSKVLTALTIAALTLSFASSGSAKKIQTKPAPLEEQAQTPPAPEAPSLDSFAANKSGLYQVHGNAEEWTEDCYNKRYIEDTPADGSPWLEGNCTKRMVRGGGWSASPGKIRSGYRDSSDAIGGMSFRVVRTLNMPL